MGHVKDEAMTVPGCGSREECCDRELFQISPSVSSFKLGLCHTPVSRHQSGSPSTRSQGCPLLSIEMLSSLAT